MYTHILLEKKDSLAIVTMNRPETYNAMNRVMAAELCTVLQMVDEDDEVRAVIVTGAGRAFCSGQDLADIEDLENVPFDTILDEQYSPIVRTITAMTIPVIAYVNGFAAGAGANLAHLCDIVLASDAARFVQAFSKIGLVPDTGGTWMLPRIVGYQRAMAMMMTGDQVSAEQALVCGMVYQVWPADVAMDEVIAFGQKISKMPTAALVETKKLLLASYDHTLEEQLELEKAAQVRLGKSYDFSEGVKAFLEKRKPEFRGE